MTWLDLLNLSIAAIGIPGSLYAIWQIREAFNRRTSSVRSSTRHRRHVVLSVLGWGFASSVVFLLAGSIFVGYQLWSASRNLPDWERLVSYQPADSMQSKRIFTPINVIPSVVVSAALCAGDRDCHVPDAISFRDALLYAVRKSIALNTDHLTPSITQQVASALLLPTYRGADRKWKIAVLAIRLDAGLPKEKIIELYLNEMNFGRQSYGIAKASLSYFGKTLDRVTLEEAAFLATLPRNPEIVRLDNAESLVNAIERRNLIIDRMQNRGLVNPAIAGTAKRKPLAIK